MHLFLAVALFISASVSAFAQFNAPGLTGGQPVPVPVTPPPITPPPGPFTGPAGACKAGGTGTVTVTLAQPCQVMDGFGVYPYTTTFFQEPFDFSIMRYAVPYFGTSNPCSIVQSSCVTGGNADITVAQNVIAAAKPDLKTLWTVWNYPSVLGSTGDCPVDPNAAAGDATFLANFLDSLRIYFSIVPSAVSVQNEPDNTWSCSQTLMTADQMHSLIVNNIGPTLTSRGLLTNTKLMMPESFQTTDLGNYLTPTMNDAAAAAYVGIEASHQYDSNSNVQVVNPFISNGKHLWETETSGLSGGGPSLCGGCWDPSMADGLMWAGIMDRWLAGANASGWLWWVDATCGGSDNQCLQVGSTISKRAYVMAQYAKWVRPGWVMIAATHDPQSGVTVTAYRNPATKDYAIVAVNQNGGALSQSFSLNGGTTATVTPWITSSSLSMAQQSAVSVGGSSFTYTLSANSVTTFVGASN